MGLKGGVENTVMEIPDMGWGRDEASADAELRLREWELARNIPLFIRPLLSKSNSSFSSL